MKRPEKQLKDNRERVLTVCIFRNGAELVGEYTASIGSARYTGSVAFSDVRQIPDVCKHVAQMWQDQRRRLGLA